MAKHDFKYFDTLYEFYFPKLYSFVWSKVNDNKVAEDLVSEIFIKVLRGLPKFEWKNVPFGAWIFAIARNHLKDYYSKNSLKKEDNVDLSEIQIKDESVDRNPQTTAENSEITKIIMEEINSLEEREKEVISLKFFADLKNKEIAESLNLSEQNVAVILFRTLKKLKEPLSKLTK